MGANSRLGAYSNKYGNSSRHCLLVKMASKAQDALSPLLGSKIQANIFVLNLRLFDYSQLLISLQAIRKFLRERPKSSSSRERQEGSAAAQAIAEAIL